MPALVLWQAGAVGAVLAALLATPAAVATVVDAAEPGVRLWALLLACVVTAVVTARLLFSGLRVGRRLRLARRRHRELVDLLAVADPADPADPEGRGRPDGMRVLERPLPTAYCVPRLANRVVITRGTLDSLARDELGAVLLHERAHLSARHDLVLEFFAVVHESVPRFMRSPQALHSVSLLIEVLADQATVRGAGVLATARAIVAMASGPHPDGALGMSGAASNPVTDARVRIELLEGGRVLGLPNFAASLVMYAITMALTTAPMALFALVLSATAGRSVG